VRNPLRPGCHRLLLGACATFVVCAVGAAQPAFLAFETTPPTISLVGAGARQQLAVTGKGHGGTTFDLTSQVHFAVEPAEIAAVSSSGVVTPLRDGQGIIRLEAAGRVTTIPLRIASMDLPRRASYRRDVVAILSKAGCNAGACHGNLNGKGGFRLSLRGDDPAFDLPAITREALGRRVNLAAPASSLIVTKPTGLVPHEGGQRLTPGSPETSALTAWLAAGAVDDVATAPKLARLTVFPTERVAAHSSLTQQLVITAEFGDGTTADVTRQAAFDVSDPTKVTVSADGLVAAARPTETVIAVRYLTGRAVSRLAFLPDHPGFAWREPVVRNVLDHAVFGKLKAFQLQPSEPAVDSVFLRRAYLDALGILPTPDEARAFLKDDRPDKRGRLIRDLMKRPEFADFWALKWADLLRNEEKTMGVKGVWIFQRWLRDKIDADAPWDEIVRQLLTAQGSTWTNPPANFYRTNRDPSTAAEAVSQVFLGVRLQCARCHNHPFDDWTLDDYYGLAAFFGNVRQKDFDVGRKDSFDSHEINGDEIVYLAGAPGVTHPRTGSPAAPKPPHGPMPTLGDTRDARPALADWLTRENRQFARNLANRVWFHLNGRGVVDPVDDFRESNPPSNPALLDALTDAFIAGGYRLKPLVELVMTSETYQLAPEPTPSNADDAANFARATVRLLPAEVLLDALGQALGKPRRFDDAPRGLRATQLPGAKMGGSFLKAFGKPDRLLTCECERSESTTLSQAFQLINGDSVRNMLDADDNRVGKLLDAKASEDAILDELTLAALARFPSATEKTTLLAHVHKATDPRKAWEDVAWALVTSKEFLLRH
jgi:Protein of unknown function (DUF1549)/Protein of unknown function (DUF1553)